MQTNPAVEQNKTLNGPRVHGISLVGKEEVYGGNDLLEINVHCIINLFTYLLYNRSHHATKLKSKCTIKLTRMQRDLTYSKLTRNRDRPRQ